MALVNRILVPTDFSDTARRALDYAVELARISKAPLRLVHVHALPVVYAAEGVFVSPLWNEAEILLDLEDGLAKLAADARERGVADVTTKVLEGSAWQAIVKAAEEGGFDLIVMGTHGRTGLAAMVVGSVTEKVVRTSSIPVLTLRDQD